MNYENNKHDAVQGESDIYDIPQLSFDDPVPQKNFPPGDTSYQSYSSAGGIIIDEFLPPQEPFPGQEWSSGLPVPGLPYTQPGTGRFDIQTPPPVSPWSPVTPSPDAPPQVAQLPFPVSYQLEDARLPAVQQSTTALHIMPEQSLESMLPQKPDIVRIEPYFTKPRPVLAPMRIISGFVSVCIVTALLCVGSVHLVQSTGIVATLAGQRDFASIQVTPALPLPEPAHDQEAGPAASIISSAATTLRYNVHTLQPMLPTKDFLINQPVYVTYGVTPPANERGQVTIKWYTNNHFFVQQQSDVVDARKLPAGDGKAGLFSVRFSLPAECSAQLYWNNILAKTLYFVVRS